MRNFGLSGFAPKFAHQIRRISRIARRNFRSHQHHHPATSCNYPVPRNTMTIIDRPIATISLRDYESRKEELVSQLLSIAENDGFFALTHHGISDQEIQTMFAMSEKFFSLPPETKSKYPFERSKVPPNSRPPNCSSADLGSRTPGGSPIHNFVPRRGRTI